MKLDRLLGILTLLLQHDSLTAPFLAQRFEVSRRTISRDIDTLGCAGIPITTRQGKGGGISIADGYRLDKRILTSGELSDILAALKGIGSVEESPRLAATLEKLHPGKDSVISLHEPIVIDLASHYKGQLAPKIEAIKQAILHRTLIEFDYFYEKGESRRTIEPCFVVFQWSSWYVFGYCLLRQDYRLFKLQRLLNLRVSEERFPDRPIPEDKSDFAARFPDDKLFRALFHPSTKYQLIETYGPDCYTIQPDGRLLLQAGYTNQEYLVSWLLGFGGRAEVVEPPLLAHQIREAAEDILTNYSKQDR